MFLLDKSKPAQGIARSQIQLRGRMKWHDYSVTITQAEPTYEPDMYAPLHVRQETILDKQRRMRKRLILSNQLV